jgi:hypothetical protein
MQATTSDPELIRKPCQSLVASSLATIQHKERYGYVHYILPVAGCCLRANQGCGQQKYNCCTAAGDTDDWPSIHPG